ncbi:MAG TPA: histidine phosphatase family protein [Mycobacterium sp.]|nr:histidine phosphatase family protein [Mycobacterium sp.]
MRLLFIRHAQTASNTDHRFDTTWPGPGLNACGVAQARTLATDLVGTTLDAVYASSLRRAVMTAEPLAENRHLTVERRDGLREIGAGNFETRNDPEAQRRYHDIVFGWSSGALDVRMPGGPNGHEFFQRFDAVIDEIAARGLSTVAVVSHGAAIRVWVSARTRNVSPTWALTHGLRNVSVVVVGGSPRVGWSTLQWAPGRSDSFGPPEIADSRGVPG